MAVIAKSNSGRDRSGVVNRHLLPNPLNNIHDAENWENGVIKGRIPDLFKSRAGLPGHAQQIQNELNRLDRKKMEGMSGTHIDRLNLASKRIISAVEKSQGASGFRTRNTYALICPLTNRGLQI